MSADTAPAAMPGVEEIARALHAAWYHAGRQIPPGFPGDYLNPTNRFSDHGVAHERLLSQARAVLALFAPILAEKENRAVFAEGNFKTIAQENQALLDRALAAEAALAAERERAASIVEDWAEQHAAGLAEDGPSPLGRHRVAMNDGYALAAAIRAQGE